MKRILDSIKSVGLMDAGRYTWGNISANVTTEEHVTLAKTIAVQSTVLLANDGILPLSFTSAADEVCVHDGSARMHHPYHRLRPCPPVSRPTGYRHSLSKPSALPAPPACSAPSWWRARML